MARRKIELERLQRGSAKRDDPLLAALAEDRNGAAVEIHLIEPQADQLASPQAASRTPFRASRGRAGRAGSRVSIAAIRTINVGARQGPWQGAWMGP